MSSALLGSVTEFISVIPAMPRTKTVLVADDRAQSRELLRIVLEQSGHDVFEAGDGHEAVYCALNILPDLIVLGLRMKGIDGLEVLRTLRRDERLRRTPIVALTASAMRGDRERALCEGFNAYLVKPVGLSVLRREMERLLG